MRAHLATVGVPLAALLVGALVAGASSVPMQGAAWCADVDRMGAEDRGLETPEASPVLELEEEETEEDSDSGDEAFTVLAAERDAALASRRLEGSLLAAESAQLRLGLRAARAPPA